MKATAFAAALLLVICLFLNCQEAKAQGVGSSADLTGTVTDPAGASVPNAKLTAVDEARGVQRSSVTDEQGTYRLSSLAPTSYKITVEHAGFQTEITTGVVLTVGQTVVLDFHLKVAATSSTVEVTSELPVVETERGSQANTITQNYVEDLPINQRSYLAFTLLAPGVSNSNTIADNADFRVKQTPQSGL